MPGFDSSGCARYYSDGDEDYLEWCVEKKEQEEKKRLEDLEKRFDELAAEVEEIKAREGIEYDIESIKENLIRSLNKHE